MERWKDGKMERWKDGKMERCEKFFANFAILCALCEKLKYCNTEELYFTQNQTM
jgi:hypothetical protein